ncbi:MAG: ankyrin repeat domain-containing protein [Gammaproteobacteria bacterium]
MIIIFLDIDGILLFLNDWRKLPKEQEDFAYSYFVPRFNKAALANLEQLIAALEKTGHEVGIVIISDWRLGHSVCSVSELFSSHSFAQKIVGKTTDRVRKRTDERRGTRIDDWLKEHKDWNIHKFVILDDNIYNIKTLFPENFVHCTSGVFSKVDLQKALKIIKPEEIIATANEEKAGLDTWPFKVVNSAAIQFAKKGELKSLQSLLQLKPELLEQQDACGHTPLLWAVIKKHKDIVQYLVNECGANLEVATQAINHEHHNRTALHWAAINGDREMTSILLDAGANVTAPSGSMMFQPIHLAAQSNHVNVLRELITFDCDLIDEKDGHGQTALQWAISHKHTNAAEFLIQQGADFSASTQIPDHKKHGYTALHYAIESGQLLIVERIVEAFASLGLIEDQANATVPLLFLAAIAPIHQREILQLLFKNKASVSKAWQHACKNENMAVAVILYENCGGVSFLNNLIADLRTDKEWQFLKNFIHGNTLSEQDRNSFIFSHAELAIQQSNAVTFQRLMQTGFASQSPAPNFLQKRAYVKGFVEGLIKVTDDPLKLINYFNILFNSEVQNPLLTKIENRKMKLRLTDPRWNQRHVSRVWTNLTDLAVSKILTLAPTQSKWSNNEEIKIFLKSHTRRWPTLFSGSTALARYTRLTSQQSDEQQSSVTPHLLRGPGFS